MKLISPTFFLLGSLFLFTASLSAQSIVATRPHPPQTMTPRKVCDQKSTWIKGHWRWDKKKQTYLWQKGQCIKVQKGSVYKSGKWRKVANGWLWEPGKWQKVSQFSSTKR
ncbi:MAG: hypothetical protein AAF399_11315 [Bacteroidota bacterium]